MISLVRNDQEYRGLSCEGKPEMASNGEKLVHIDTGDEFVYSEIAETWIQTKAGSIAFVEITIDTPPTKTTYYEGEMLDLTGLVVEASYDDESTLDVTKACKTDINRPLKASDAKVVISVGEHEVEQSITVVEIKVESISVTKNPTKTEYVKGETFDMSGLEITATYTDGSTVLKTEEASYSPDQFTPLETTDTAITVSYGGKTTTILITVTEAEE